MQIFSLHCGHVCIVKQSMSGKVCLLVRPPYCYREPILSAHEIYLDKKSCIRSKNEIPDKLGVCLRRYTYAQ